MAYTMNRENARVYKGLLSGVWAAPKGSTLPTITDESSLKSDPVAPFAALGWLGEDGIKTNREQDFEEYRASQNGSLVLKLATETTQTWTFVAMEETAVTLGLVYGDDALSEVGTSTGVTKIDRAKNEAKLQERALIIDAEGHDGTFERTLVSAASIEMAGEVTVHHASDMRMYEFTATALAGAVVETYTNAASITLA